MTVLEPRIGGPNSEHRAFWHLQELDTLHRPDRSADMQAEGSAISLHLSPDESVMLI